MNIDLQSLVVRSTAVDELRELERSGVLKREIPMLSVLNDPRIGSKDTFEHSLTVLENARRLSKDPNDVVMFIAALLHDVGKPATMKRVASRNFTFQHHETVGARMLRPILPDFGLSKVQADEVETIVRHHMRGHTYSTGWTDSAVRRLDRDAGSEVQFERLVTIFSSDASTIREDKIRAYRKNALKLLEHARALRKSDADRARSTVLNGHEVAELLNLKPGPELGRYMKFLKTDEGLALSRSEAIAAILRLSEES